MRVTSIDYLHETGAKRNQEDFLWPLPGTASEQDRIFIVCDGVGGSESGEVASQYIAEWVAQGLRRASDAEVGLPLVNSLLEEARSRLVEHALLKGLGKDMATTFTLLYLLNDRAFIAWCGDSRELSEEDARDHPQKNLLLKAIRADEPGPEAEGHWVEEIRDGDYFLLCTDGLLENISDADVLFLLQQSEHREMYLAKAFRTYCYNKTRDNYSMYLIRVNPSVAPAFPAPVQRGGSRSWMVLLMVVLIAAAAFVMRGHLPGSGRPSGAAGTGSAGSSGVTPGAAGSSGAAPGSAGTGSGAISPAPAALRRDSTTIPTLVPTAASAKDTITP